MDGDPAVESELDSFSLTFPLPYRVGFIITLGMSHFTRQFAPWPCAHADDMTQQLSGAGALIFTISMHKKSTSPR